MAWPEPSEAISYSVVGTRTFQAEGPARAGAAIACQRHKDNVLKWKDQSGEW